MFIFYLNDNEKVACEKTVRELNNALSFLGQLILGSLILNGMDVFRFHLGESYCFQVVPYVTHWLLFLATGPINSCPFCPLTKSGQTFEKAFVTFHD